MNHTGVCGTVSPRQARMSGDPAGVRMEFIAANRAMSEAEPDNPGRTPPIPGVYGW
jgi:hypothetical protein